MIRTLSRGLVALIGLLGASAATAQDVAEDWDFVERNRAVSASIAYDSGLAVAVRCDGQNLETYIVGLPVPQEQGDQRTIRYAFGDLPMRDSTWQASADGLALFADLPAPLARRFRAGGDLQLVAAGRDGEPSRRYVITLPPSPAAVNRVLAACGRPADDQRDTLRISETSADAAVQGGEAARWASHPRPTYPDRAVMNGISGMAVLSCLTQDDGRLKDCQVEVERPGGADFGRAALRAARDARLQRRSQGESRPGDGLVTFTIRFNIPGR
ncbi:TonB family protein [Brevundimonas staleyi]|uniref:TonB family protein n=1 Tax=Brevundimonas staleyi TaxID=74326 RepID=A0ABW0FX01_9CAUL